MEKCSRRSTAGQESRPPNAALFAEVVKLRARIWSVLWFSGVPARERDDMLQTCLLVAWRRSGDFAGEPTPERVAAWVSGIARWTAWDSNRARAAYTRVFPEGDEVHPEPLARSPAELFDAKERLEAVAAQPMGPKLRATVGLAALGYTAPEIGRRLGIPTESASTRVKLARRVLRRVA